ncbi:M56 family metallopeptidase [Acidicapsa acidisoli]|uniref:M56 family metallopeptidase n=1 Tax=Acidicapsa acidisoli TaxID=1615681 RepID=UPI0021E03789|nr:M56 family metallopeptidase [Acidicapsa acidisoli]
MNHMNHTFASWLIEYLLNSVWQVPLVFAAASIAAHLARPVGARTEHRVWVSSLIVATILPLCNFSLSALWQQALALAISAWPGKPGGGGSIRILLGSGSVQSSGLHPAPWLATGIISLYACTVLYFTTRLAYGILRTVQIRKQSQPIQQSSELTTRFNHFRQRFLIRNGQLAISDAVHGPVTIGIRRPALLIPPGFFDRLCEDDRRDDLDTVLAHETAHMQRHDFAKNLLYELLSLPLSFHPILWLFRSRIAETREMVCDESAARATAGQGSYARSLLRLATTLSCPTPQRNLHAIGILDASNFERRVMNLTRNRPNLAAPRKFLIVAVCAAIALGTCASAIALRMEIAGVETQPDAPKKIHVKSTELKVISHATPVYPQEAKEKRISGDVIVEAIISKEGVPSELRIQEGPKELQASALDAIRQWRYEPFLLNGNPVEVETTITVVYSLAN